MIPLSDRQLHALWWLHREWIDDEMADLLHIAEEDLNELKSQGLVQRQRGKWGPTAKGSSFVEQNKKIIEERIKGF